MSGFVQDRRAVAMAMSSTLRLSALGPVLGLFEESHNGLVFIEYSEMFCWWLYSVTSFRVWVQLLHLRVGSANVQACFYSDAKVLLRHRPGAEQQLLLSAGSGLVPPPPPPSSPCLLSPAPGSPRERAREEAQKDKCRSPWTVGPGALRNSSSITPKSI